MPLLRKELLHSISSCTNTKKHHQKTDAYVFKQYTIVFYSQSREENLVCAFSWTNSTMNVKTGFNRNLTSSKYNSWTCSKQSNNPFCHPSKNFPKRNNPKHIISCQCRNGSLRWTPFRDKVWSKENSWRPKSTESSIPLLLACRFFILIPKGHQMHFLSSESLSCLQ